MDGGGLRQRTPAATRRHSAISTDQDDDEPKMRKVKVAKKALQQSAWGDSALIALITLLAFITRFYAIHNPNLVVFDEVHFGKYASYYIQRTFFFDVHPPLGKLLLALVGYIFHFSGHFKFSEIGSSYVGQGVPYIAMRGFSALCGALLCPLVFRIMRSSGYSRWASTLAAPLTLFGNSFFFSCLLYT